MGLLITVCLITWNIYGTTEAPPSRGFSYIEMWITIVQFNILLAIFEYSCILVLKRSNIRPRIFKKKFLNLDQVIKIIDMISLFVSVSLFSVFNVFYWTKTKSLKNVDIM